MKTKLINQHLKSILDILKDGEKDDMLKMFNELELYTRPEYNLKIEFYKDDYDGNCYKFIPMIIE